jgi:hypothetical protein
VQKDKIQQVALKLNEKCIVQKKTILYKLWTCVGMHRLVQESSIIKTVEQWNEECVFFCESSNWRIVIWKFFWNH